MASQITGVSIVYPALCSGTDQRNPQNSVSLAFVRDSPHKGRVTRKMSPFDDAARSYRRQDGADAAAGFEKFLPARTSLRPPISLKFATE